MPNLLVGYGSWEQILHPKKYRLLELQMDEGYLQKLDFFEIMGHLIKL
jgi:hypothetical protein